MSLFNPFWDKKSFPLEWTCSGCQQHSLSVNDISYFSSGVSSFQTSVSQYLEVSAFIPVPSLQTVSLVCGRSVTGVCYNLSTCSSVGVALYSNTFIFYFLTNVAAMHSNSMRPMGNVPCSKGMQWCRKCQHRCHRRGQVSLETWYWAKGSPICTSLRTWPVFCSLL